VRSRPPLDVQFSPLPCAGRSAAAGDSSLDTDAGTDGDGDGDSEISEGGGGWPHIRAGDSADRSRYMHGGRQGRATGSDAVMADGGVGLRDRGAHSLTPIARHDAPGGGLSMPLAAGHARLPRTATFHAGRLTPAGLPPLHLSFAARRAVVASTARMLDGADGDGSVELSDSAPGAVSARTASREVKVPASLPTSVTMWGGAGAGLMVGVTRAVSGGSRATTGAGTGTSAIPAPSVRPSLRAPLATLVPRLGRSVTGVPTATDRRGRGAAEVAYRHVDGGADGRGDVSSGGGVEGGV